MNRKDRFTMMELIASDVRQAIWHLARIFPKWLCGLQGFGNYSHGKAAWRMFVSAISRPYWHAWRWWNCIDELSRVRSQRDDLHFALYFLLSKARSIPRGVDGELDLAIQQSARALEEPRV